MVSLLDRVKKALIRDLMCLWGVKKAYIRDVQPKMGLNYSAITIEKSWLAKHIRLYSQLVERRAKKVVRSSQYARILLGEQIDIKEIF